MKCPNTNSMQYIYSIYVHVYIYVCLTDLETICEQYKKWFHLQSLTLFPWGPPIKKRITMPSGFSMSRPWRAMVSSDISSDTDQADESATGQQPPSIPCASMHRIHPQNQSDKQSDKGNSMDNEHTKQNSKPTNKRSTSYYQSHLI